MFRKYWQRYGAVLILAAIFLLSGLLVLAQGSGTLARITTASNSDRASFASFAPILSNDGNRLVFVSDSDFLNQGINDEQFEIWLYDTVALTLTRITTVSDNDRASRAPSPNGDGTRIVFLSDSDFLNQGINPGQDEVWLYDTQTMTLTRVTTAVPGNRRSFYPTISNDGTRVVFESDADFLGQGIVQNQLELWLYDTQTMTLTRITTATAPSRISLDPAFSLDGDWLAFASQSDLLNEGLFSLYRIWLYNTTNGTLTRVTDEPFGRGSRAPSLNGDGSQVVFHSDTDILNQGIPDEQNEIWLYDTQSVTFTRITVASDASRDSLRPRISEDGTKVVFYSDSDFLGQGLADEQYEIWLYDTQTMTFTRVTSAAGADRASIQPSLSADGRRIAFQSDADFLNQAIPDDQDEIWLYQAPPNLHLAKIASSDPVTALTTLTYTVVLSNSGGDAPDGVITDVLDANTVLAWASDNGVQQPGSSSWLVWDVGLITRGQTITRTIMVTVSKVATGTFLTNTVWATSGRGGSAIAAITTTAHEEAPDLYLTKAVFPNPATAGDWLTYTIALSNGGGIAPGVVITDQIDSRTTFAWASDGGFHQAGLITWPIGTLAGGRMVTRTLLVSVSQVVSGTFLTNTVWAISDRGGGAATSLTGLVVDRISRQSLVYLPVITKP